MVKYPNGIKKKTNTSNKQSKNQIKSWSNRGMTLENMVNETNKFYIETNKANIHKKPTPVTIVKVDYPSRDKAKIVEAYFKLPSTTDYNGIYKGKYLDFECKEVSIDSFPFKLIHEHQIKHLKQVSEMGAIAFLILKFTKYEETYLIDAKVLIDHFYNSKRRSFSYKFVKENFDIIPFSLSPKVDYLKIVDKIYLGDNI